MIRRIDSECIEWICWLSDYGCSRSSPNPRVQGSEIFKILKLRKHIVIQGSRLQGCSVYLFSFFAGGVLVFNWKNTEPGFLQGWQGCLLEPAVLLCSMCLSVALGFLWGSSSWGVCWWDPATTLSHEIWKSASALYLHLLMQNSVGSASVDFSAAGRPGEKNLHPITSQLTKQECWAGWKDRNCASGWI